MSIATALCRIHNISLMRKKLGQLHLHKEELQPRLDSEKTANVNWNRWWNIVKNPTCQPSSVNLFSLESKVGVSWRPNRGQPRLCKSEQIYNVNFVHAGSVLHLAFYMGYFTNITVCMKLSYVWFFKETIHHIVISAILKREVWNLQVSQHLLAKGIIWMNLQNHTKINLNCEQILWGLRNTCSYKAGQRTLKTPFKDQKKRKFNLTKQSTTSLLTSTKLPTVAFTITDIIPMSKGNQAPNLNFSDIVHWIGNWRTSSWESKQWYHYMQKRYLGPMTTWLRILDVEV